MNIAIVGFGVEGKASYQYFKERGNDVTVLDERTSADDLPVGVPHVLGGEAFMQLGEFDMVVRSPSISPKKLAGAKKIWSATNEFFAQCPAPIIGVTGTKGKGTTCSLITAILQNSGRTVHLLGNIGTPALAVLPSIKPDDIVVYELSSFQLWDLEKSPTIAVVLLVEPDHLNVHEDFDEYAAAKGNIAAYQKETDMVIYHPENETSARIARMSQGRKLRFMTPEAAHIEDDGIMIDGVRVCSVNEVGLLGDYNLQNICAALSAAWLVEQNTDAAAKALREFKGLEHRLEFVAEKRGVRYYNDSFSSAPTATMAAVTAFSQPIILIAGGFDRGIDLAPLAARIAQTPLVKRVIAIGQVRERLMAELKTNGFDRCVLLDGLAMNEIVARAADEATEGDVVLLSPGCASFDMFTNFAERGRLFKDAVRNIDE